MKHFPFLIFVLLVFAACNSNKSKTTSTNTIKSTSQEITSDDLWEDPPMLLGSFEVDELKKAPYNEWYVPIYEETVLDEERVAYLGTLMEDVEIIGFVGTWCKDRKSTRLNSSHVAISYAVFCLKKKNHTNDATPSATSHSV